MTRYVRPVYPIAAKRQRIQGIVRLRGVVTVRGDLRKLEVLEGNPIFVPAALRTIREPRLGWRLRERVQDQGPVAPRRRHRHLARID